MPFLNENGIISWRGGTGGVCLVISEIEKQKNSA